MHIRFQTREGASSAALEVAELHFASRELREGKAGRLISRHPGHYWLVQNREYLRLDCEGPLKLVFEEGGRRSESGPYAHFSCVDGVAFSDRVVIAHLDAASGRWFGIADGVEWPGFSVFPVS